MCMAFAVAAHLDPEILVVDGSLAVTCGVSEEVFGKDGDVADEGRGTVLFVGHNMSAIKNLCQNAFLLDGGKIINQVLAIELSILIYLLREAIWVLDVIIKWEMDPSGSHTHG